MAITFLPASTENTYVRMALVGGSGSGKTLTALKIAKALGDRVYVLDTERNTARLYANHPETPKPYYIYNLKRFEPQAYCMALDEVAAAGANVCIVDSITPSWNGQGGTLDIAGSDIRGWKTATPLYNDLVNKLTSFNTSMHVIVTLRSKMEYSMAIDPATGKMKVEKVGMQPIHRDEFTYEWDLVGSMDQSHTLSFGGVGKSRFPALDNQSFANPGAELGEAILEALQGGTSD